MNLFNSNDAFDQKTSIDDSLVQEYYERNQRKSEDDKWLKANKPAILKAMNELAKEKADFGDLRVTVSTPDQSSFDMDKVLQYCVEHNLLNCLKYTVDEQALTAALEDGQIDVEELKAAAWVQKYGSPRLLVKTL